MRRICSLLLTLCLLLGLAACGGQTAKSSMPLDTMAPTWQEQYDLGVRYLSEGNYEEAIIAFTAAIEIDPKRAEAYVGRGDAYMGLGESEENLAAALADYEQAIELDDTIAAAYLGLAEVNLRLYNDEKALDILRIGLGKTGGDQFIANKIAEMEGAINTAAAPEPPTEQTTPDIPVAETVQDCVLNFNPNQGSVSLNSKNITSGHAAGDLPTPIREGYIFDGWYTSPEGGLLVTDSTIITEDLILYAHWLQKEPPPDAGKKNYVSTVYEWDDEVGTASVQVLSEVELIVSMELFSDVEYVVPENRYCVDFWSKDLNEYNEPLWSFCTFIYAGEDSEPYALSKYDDYDTRWGIKESPEFTTSNIEADYANKTISWTVTISDTAGFNFNDLNGANMYASLNEEKG